MQQTKDAALARLADSMRAELPSTPTQQEVEEHVAQRAGVLDETARQRLIELLLTRGVEMEQTSDGMFLAYDNDTGHTWKDKTELLARLGLAVFNAVDSTLPTDEANEDARHDLWHKISNAAMESVRNVTASESAGYTDRTARFFPPKHHPNDPDPWYRWQQRVNMMWEKDGDGLPRQEIGHGRTREEAEHMARHTAAAFMACEEVGSEDWPTTKINDPEADAAERYAAALVAFRDKLDDGVDFDSYSEYVRGGLDLLAELFPVVGMDTGTRMDQIRDDLRKLPMHADWRYITVNHGVRPYSHEPQEPEPWAIDLTVYVNASDQEDAQRQAEAVMDTVSEAVGRDTNLMHVRKVDA